MACVGEGPKGECTSMLSSEQAAGAGGWVCQALHRVACPCSMASMSFLWLGAMGGAPCPLATIS
ncbi:hypothetical protein HAX54_034150, partial [Datura stramonium]|nr:hypothetical protein [Datura stramonium]